jgi:hypothetical protein
MAHTNPKMIMDALNANAKKGKKKIKVKPIPPAPKEAGILGD